MLIFRCKNVKKKTKNTWHLFLLGYFLISVPCILVLHYFPHLLHIYALKLELRIVLLCFEYRSDTSIYRDSFVYHVVAESATIDFRFQASRTCHYFLAL